MKRLWTMLLAPALGFALVSTAWAIDYTLTMNSGGYENCAYTVTTNDVAVEGVEGVYTIGGDDEAVVTWTAAGDYMFDESWTSTTSITYTASATIAASPVLALAKAAINTDKFRTLADAIAAVPTDGTATTNTILADFSEDADTVSVHTIAAGKNVVLDLNGHVITVNKRSGVSGVWMNIAVGAELTAETSVGGGKITFVGGKPTNDWVQYAYLFQNSGTLNIKSGTYEMELTNGMGAAACWIGYVVQQQVHVSGNAEFNFLGGVINQKGYDQAIRFYNNSASASSTNVLNIAGGTVQAGGIFIDNCNCTVESEINVTSGTLNGLLDFTQVKDNLAVNIAGGTHALSKINVRSSCSNTEPFITIEGGSIDLAAVQFSQPNPAFAVKGGTFVDNGIKATIQGYIPTNYAARDNADPANTWSAYLQYMCQIVDGDKYESLAAAFTNAQAGDTVQLIEDSECVVNGDYATVSGKAITLDLNGRTIQGTSTVNRQHAMIHVQPTGSLTFRDTVGDGAFMYYHNNAGAPKYSAGFYAVLNQGTFTMQSGSIIANDNIGDLVYGIENRVNSNHATLNIEDGYICVHDWYGQSCIRVYSYDAAVPIYTNLVNISGGTFDNVYPFSMTKANQGARSIVNISGGVFNGYTRFRAYGDYTRVNISGGEFNVLDDEVDVTAGTVPYIKVTGGIWRVDPAKFDLAENTYLFESATVISPLVTPLSAGYIASYSATKASGIDGYTDIYKKPATFTLALGANVASATITKNGDAVDGLTTSVAYGDEIAITSMAYAAGYEGTGSYTNGYAEVLGGTSFDGPEPLAGITWTALAVSGDPIPSLPVDPSAEVVSNKVVEAGFADATVQDLIAGDPSTYNTFKAWAGTVAGGEAAVVAAAHAAASFQLRGAVESPTLFENDPTLKITALAEDEGNWDLTVQLKDGETEIQLRAAVDAFANKVKTGTAPGAITTPCTADDMAAAVQEGAKVKLTITPPAGATGFFTITFD